MVQETGKIGQCREFLPLLCVCFLFLSAYNCFIIISLSPSHDKFTSSFFHLSLSLSLSVFSFACACERSQQLHHHHNSTVTDFQGTFISAIPCYVFLLQFLHAWSPMDDRTTAYVLLISFSSAKPQSPHLIGADLLVDCF